MAEISPTLKIDKLAIVSFPNVELLITINTQSMQHIGNNLIINNIYITYYNKKWLKFNYDKLISY